MTRISDLDSSIVLTRQRYEEEQKEVLELLRLFQEAKEIDREAVLGVFSQLREKLEGLIRYEEVDLFPHFDAVNGLSDEGPTAVMRVEHRQIRRLLCEIEEKLLEGNLKTDAEQVVLLGTLHSHQQLERTFVGPALAGISNRERSSGSK